MMILFVVIIMMLIGYVLYDAREEAIDARIAAQEARATELEDARTDGAKAMIGSIFQILKDQGSLRLNVKNEDGEVETMIVVPKP